MAVIRPTRPGADSDKVVASVFQLKPALSSVRLMLFALLWTLATSAHAVGILAVRARVEPEQIAPGGKATVMVWSTDGFQKPLRGVMVRITSQTGYFKSTHNIVVDGMTDQSGAFEAEWQSTAGTSLPANRFDIVASKSGYIGKPIIRAKVILTETTQEGVDTRRRPAEQSGQSREDQVEESIPSMEPTPQR